MTVLPQARGLGVGRLLLAEVEAFAAASCERLGLATTPFLHPATRLYESLGFFVTRNGPDDLFGTPLFTAKKTLTHRVSLSANPPKYPSGRGGHAG